MRKRWKVIIDYKQVDGVEVERFKFRGTNTYQDTTINDILVMCANLMLKNNISLQDLTKKCREEKERIKTQKEEMQENGQDSPGWFIPY